MHAGSSRKALLVVALTQFGGCSPPEEVLRLDAAVEAYRAAAAEGLPREVLEESPRFYGPVWWDSKDSIPVDSDEVNVELLVFEPGGGFHGPDFRYLLSCTSGCVIRELIGRGYLN